MVNPFHRPPFERSPKFQESETGQGLRSHVDLTDPAARRLGYADNAAAKAALPHLTLTGGEQNTLARNDAKAAKGDASPKSDSAKDDDSTKSNNSKDQQSESGEPSGGKKKGGGDDDLYKKPLSTDKNSDGSTTEHYLDGHSVTKYPDGSWKWQNKPGDIVQTFETSADGKTRMTTSEGMTITDDRKTGETTYSNARSGQSATFKDGKLVSKGP
jgi:hypothetical protein